MSTIAHHRNPWRRARVVPPWFKDLLHTAIYADADDAHRMIWAFYAALAVSPSDGTVLVEAVAGATQGEIAARLGTSRHHICRKLKRLRRALGDNLLRLPPDAASLLAAFVKRGGPDDPNMRTVVERLRPLSRNELGVLFGLMRRQTKGEIICGLGIGHTRYHQIKAMLSEAFPLPPARMRKSQLCACIRNADLVQFPSRSEKCTFSDT